MRVRTFLNLLVREAPAGSQKWLIHFSFFIHVAMGSHNEIRLACLFALTCCTIYYISVFSFLLPHISVAVFSLWRLVGPACNKKLSKKHALEGHLFQKDDLYETHPQGFIRLIQSWVNFKEDIHLTAPPLLSSLSHRVCFILKTIPSALYFKHRASPPFNYLSWIHASTGDGFYSKTTDPWNSRRSHDSPHKPSSPNSSPEMAWKGPALL